MPTLNQLRGLRATDRTDEEQKAINQQMGYKEKPSAIPVITQQASSPTIQNEPKADTTSALTINQAIRYQRHLDEQYQQALAEKEDTFGLSKKYTSTNANIYLDNIASQVSSYYKKFKDTDKLPLSDQEKKQLAAQYDARKEVYGEQNADIWLDKYMKDKVGENQSWWEQATNAISHLIPAIEGGAIQAYGMVHGAINHILGTEGYNNNPDLNWWDSFMDDVLDNPVTRYGRDVELAGASNIIQGLGNALGIMDETAAERIAATKASATRYNPEGIGDDAIVTTSEQDEKYISSATPWQALQSGGFTALSMLVGAGEAKLAGWLFNAATKGVNWLNSTNKAFKTAEALEKALTGIKKAQNFTDTFIIPAAVGTIEGGLEGLSTKIEVEREAVQNLDEFYKDKVDKETESILNDENLNPIIDAGDGTVSRLLDPNETYRRVWDKYKEEYTDARRQIDWAASKAGIHNFYANSLINGAMNQTLKAGLMAPRVQETLRNSKMFGWAYKAPKFNIAKDGITVTPKVSKAGLIGRVLKEPLGEGIEEYSQSLSSDVFSSAAENNINEFIKNKFDPNGTVKVTDSFGSDYAAALTALKGSLTSKESIESAILGAVSSTMGTIGGISRGYHRDDDGKLVRNRLFGKENFKRSLDEKGNLESWGEYAQRIIPWRSGAINAYFDRRREIADANETAATLTEWLKDSQNQAKWDGLVGTANWMSQMENAAESNDQFSYRKAQMGKAINDAFMLKKLEGTNFHESVMADLQKAANGELSQEEIAKMRQSGGEEYQNISDQELVEKVQSNANRMLGLMTQVEKESKNIDRLLGRIDEDTKQSLIYGKVMEQNFRERKEQLQEEINTIKSKIQNSRNSNIKGGLDNELATLILQYGSLNKAIHEQERLQSDKEKTQKKVEELEAIDSNKTTDKQKEELVKSKQELKRINKKLEAFDALYEKDAEGKKTNKIDSSFAQMVLSEQDIMDLDPVTRAVVLAQGANRLYNVTHQNRQKVDQLNLEIDELNHQIEALETQKTRWLKSDGRVKKGHNKQYIRNTKKIEELKKQKEAKMRELDAEQGTHNAKPIYNSAQQEVIDNLVQQGMAQDEDFLDKVVDLGRLEKGIKDYHQEYQAILSDPRAFQNYVLKARQNAALDLIQRRADYIAGIEDYETFARELNRVTANASNIETAIIMRTLRAKDAQRKKQQQQETEDDTTSQPIEKSNFERYMDGVKDRAALMSQFVKNPNLTDNDISLLEDAMEYLQAKGIDITDRDAAVDALIEEDADGNMGGKFREYVESKNSDRIPQQRTFIPSFTSIGQIVSHYVDLINGKVEDDINKGNLNPTITPAPKQSTSTGSTPTSPSSSSSTAAPSPEPEPEPTPAVSSAGAGILAMGAQSQRKVNPDEIAQPEESQQDNKPKTAAQQYSDLIFNNIDNAKDISDDAKALLRQYFEDSDVTDVEDLLADMEEQRVSLKERFTQTGDKKYDDAVALMSEIATKLNVQKRTAEESSSQDNNQEEDEEGNPNASTIRTANIRFLEKKFGNIWPVAFYKAHNIDGWNRNHTIDPKEEIYFITDSAWTASSIGGMNDYNDLDNKPVVIAVIVETPTDIKKTTAIEVNGVWYQPIGILPSSTKKSLGAHRTRDIRSKASQEQGRHLITVDGLPNSLPLTTTIAGVNYREAEYEEKNRDNSKENNKDVFNVLLKDLAKDNTNAVDEINEASKDALFDSNSPIGTLWANIKSVFMNGLSWTDTPGKNRHRINFLPDRLRPNRSFDNPIGIEVKNMSETKGKLSGKSLLETLQNGTANAIIIFNSRTERLYSEVIRPLFTNSGKTTRAAKVFTASDLEGQNPQEVFNAEADRIAELLNMPRGIKGVKDFVFVNSNWTFEVTAPTSLQKVSDNPLECESVYKIFLHHETNETDIQIGEIRIKPNQPVEEAEAAAQEMLKNFLYDKETNSIRNILTWQVPQDDISALNNTSNPTMQTNARRNISAIIDDGILEMAGSSILYDPKSIKIRAPKAGGKIEASKDTVVNPDNAQPSSPIDVTPQGEGSIVTKDGEQIDPTSGANLDDGPKKPESTTNDDEETPQQAAARKLVNKIIADSKRFVLSEDDVYYYIEDKQTGQRTKYLRVTTVIGANDKVPYILTESEAKKERNWVPTIEKVIETLRKTHPEIPILTDAQIRTYKNIDIMSNSLGVSKQEILRAVAELRTEHKKEGYGVWEAPSTLIGDTMDTITRDFLAGNLKEEYPNITKEAKEKFIEQLELFKSELNSKGITIVSEGIMAHGNITTTDSEGKTHLIKVAGTLDLFGYDRQGNFYIFDMKTTHNHSDEKLKLESDKWSRQLSMYADLLCQQYPEIASKLDLANNLRIIPINVNYPKPMGDGTRGTSITGPLYIKGEGEEKGKLKTQLRGEEPKDFYMGLPNKDKEDNGDNSFGMRKTTLDGQYQPGYTKLHISWDNLSSEDQDIANEMEAAIASNPTPDGTPAGTPKDAHIEKPEPRRSKFFASDTHAIDDSSKGSLPPTSKPAPIVPNGEKPLMPSWEDLGTNPRGDEILESLEKKGYIKRDEETGDFEESYNDFLNSPEDVLAAYKDLKDCAGLL